MSETPAMRVPRADWHRGASLPVFAWMAAAAIAILLRGRLEHWGWFATHFLLLGAVSNALFTWMWHFTGAILRVPVQADRADELRRLLVLNLGAGGVVIGAGTHARMVLLGSAALVILAVVLLGRAVAGAVRRALPSPYAFTAQAYMVAVALLVPGLLIGTTLASTDVPESVEPRLVVAHAAMNLLGWVGVPILGTIVTLWPTMLRTRIAPQAARLARRTLPVFLVAVPVVGLGIGFGLVWLAAAGLLAYLLAAAVTVQPLVAVARTKPPTTFSTRSAAAGLAWLLGSILVFGLALVRWGIPAVDEHGAAILVMAVGGVLQVLLGCLTYLLPAMAAGGPAKVRWRNDRAERAATTRLALANAGLVLSVAAPDDGRGPGAALLLAGFAWTLVVVASSLRQPSADEVAAAEAGRTRPEGH